MKLAQTAVPYILTEQEQAEFEAWWESDGQYMRAGGGQYEKTFAYEAYQHQQQRIVHLEAQLAAQSAAVPAVAPIQPSEKQLFPNINNKEIT